MRGPFGEYTERLKVPGGWLYRCAIYVRADSEDDEVQRLVMTMCFVPDPSGRGLT